MGAVAFVAFDGFYVAAYSRSHPEAGKSIVVLKDRRVIDASADTRRLGVGPGMTAAEAKYTARGFETAPIFVEYRNEDFLPFSESYLKVCAEYASAVEPVAEHCAFLDLGLLAGAREVAYALAADLYHAVKVCARIGIAECKLVAKIAAERAVGDVEIVAARGDEAYIAPLPIESLWRVDRNCLLRLRNLGYRTVGEVAAFDAALLRKHFGDEGFRISQLAKGIDRSRIESIYPPDDIRAQFHFPQPARLSSEIEPSIFDLARTLSEELSARSRMASIIELAATFEDSSMRLTCREFAKPMHTYGALLTGLRLTLRNINIDEELASLSVKLNKVVALDTRQISMPGTSADAGSKDLILESAERTAKQLQETFGEESVLRASNRFVERRDLLLRAWKEATSWSD